MVSGLVSPLTNPPPVIRHGPPIAGHWTAMVIGPDTSFVGFTSMSDVTVEVAELAGQLVSFVTPETWTVRVSVGVIVPKLHLSRLLASMVQKPASGPVTVQVMPWGSGVVIITLVEVPGPLAVVTMSKVAVSPAAI